MGKIKFTVADEDRAQFQELVTYFGGGDPSAYVRATLRVMAAVMGAQEQGGLGDGSADPDSVAWGIAVVHQVIADAHHEAAAILESARQEAAGIGHDDRFERLGQDSTVGRILALAQRTSDESVTAARQQAEGIILEARREAARLVAVAGDRSGYPRRS